MNINAFDIFNQRGNLSSGNTNNGIMTQMRNMSSSQSFSVSVSYNFGNNSVRGTRNRDTSNSGVKGRM